MLGAIEGIVNMADISLTAGFIILIFELWIKQLGSPITGQSVKNTK
jgi:lipoprotein signal peptidase